MAEDVPQTVEDEGGPLAVRRDGWSPVAALHRSLIRRSPLEGEAIDKEVGKLDDGLVAEARRLGFELVGAARERGVMGMGIPVAYMLGPQRRIELILWIPKSSRNRTVWEMRAATADGTVIVLAPEPPHGRDVRREAEGVEFVDLPQHETLEEGLEYLRGAVAHHAGSESPEPADAEAALVPVDGVDGMIQRSNRLDALVASRRSMIKRAAKITSPLLYLLLGVALPILLFLL